MVAFYVRIVSRALCALLVRIKTFTPPHTSQARLRPQGRMQQQNSCALVTLAVIGVRSGLLYPRAVSSLWCGLRSTVH